MAKQEEIIYGQHAVKHALLKHPENVLCLWLQMGKNIKGTVADILAIAERQNIDVEYVSKEALDKHTDNAVHQGLVIRRRAIPGALSSLEDILAIGQTKSLLLLLLDGVQDPHNLGACLRTANAAGVDAVIIPKDKAVSVNATVTKVASGATEHTPVISVTNLSRCMRQLQEAGIWTVGTSDNAEKTIYEIDLKVPIAIVMGTEGQGLRHNTRQHCDYLAKLPMLGTVESLNVAVAAGVCLYEVVRQRA